MKIQFEATIVTLVNVVSTATFTVSLEDAKDFLKGQLSAYDLSDVADIVSVNVGSPAACDVIEAAEPDMLDKTIASAKAEIADAVKRSISEQDGSTR